MQNSSIEMDFTRLEKQSSAHTLTIKASAFFQPTKTVPSPVHGLCLLLQLNPSEVIKEQPKYQTQSMDTIEAIFLEEKKNLPFFFL